MAGLLEPQEVMGGLLGRRALARDTAALRRPGMDIVPNTIAFAEENPVETGLLAAGMANVPVASDVAGFAGDVLGMIKRPEERTWTNAGMAAVGLLPFVPPMAALTFAGKGAKTADLAMLNKAESMERAGIHRDTIWRETGWGRGADDQWRFEIDDRESWLEDASVRHPGAVRLQHEDLEEAHPELWSTLQQSLRKGEATKGRYDPRYNTIHGTAPRIDDLRGVALHETQHAVQEREGFAKGGSPKSFVRQARAQLDDLDEQIKWVNEQLRLSVGTPDYERFLKMRSDIFRQIDEVQGGSANNRAMGVLDRAYDQYNRLAGEVEARNVEHRMGWTPEQRRETAPWRTEDVPRNQQIVTRESGPMAHPTPKGRGFISVEDNIKQGQADMQKSHDAEMLGLVANSYRAGYNPKPLPERPFNDDYPRGARGDETGRLVESQEGVKLDAPFVAGRRSVGGRDQGLGEEELRETATRLVDEVFGGRRSQLRGGVGAYREIVGSDGVKRRVIGYDRNLTPEEVPRVIAHETGHAIADISRSIDITGLDRELRQVYHDLATGRQGQTRRKTGPEHMGYAAKEAPAELMAEAIRAYMTDPNYLKTVAPKTAKRIREAVNTDPRIARIIQFNSAAPFVAGSASVGAGLLYSTTEEEGG